MHPTQRTTSSMLFSLTEAADQLSLSRRTVERLVAQGAIRAVKVGRRRLLEATELSRFIEASKA